MRISSALLQQANMSRSTNSISSCRYLLTARLPSSKCLIVSEGHLPPPPRYERHLEKVHDVTCLGVRNRYMDSRVHVCVGSTSSIPADSERIRRFLQSTTACSSTQARSPDPVQTYGEKERERRRGPLKISRSYNLTVVTENSQNTVDSSPSRPKRFSASTRASLGRRPGRSSQPFSSAQAPSDPPHRGTTPG